MFFSDDRKILLTINLTLALPPGEERTRTMEAVLVSIRDAIEGQMQYLAAGVNGKFKVENPK